MPSPTFVHITRHASRYLCRVQSKRPELLRPSTPNTRVNEQTPSSKRRAPKKQLFTPPSKNHIRGEIIFTNRVTLSVRINAIRDLQTPKEKQGVSEFLEEESPNIGYEIDSPFLHSLCERIQPNDVLLLGRGTFGSVYFGLQGGERRALKVSEKGHLKGEQNALNLSHPNIASVLWLWSACGDGNANVAIMQYAGSLSLHKLLLKQDFSLSMQAKKSICVQVVRALEYIHKHLLVHLDVKPANILLSASTGVCKLADFGCSLLLTELKSKRNNSTARMQCSKRCALVGTVAYVAPELFHGQDPTTAADIYSLGITLYQIETKKTPFEGMHPHTLIYRVVSMKERPSIPWSTDSKGYWEIVNACWHPEPNRRPKAKDILLKLRR